MGKVFLLFHLKLLLFTLQFMGEVSNDVRFLLKGFLWKLKHC